MNMKQFLVVLIFTIVATATFTQTTGKFFSELPTMSTVDNSTFFVTLDGTPKVWKKFGANTLRSYVNPTVTSIANATAISTISNPYEGDLALNTNRDTLWIRATSAWIIFKAGTSGGGGSTPSLQSVLAVGNSANSLKITNLATPTASTDASTKGYVDTQISGVSDAANTYSITVSRLTVRDSNALLKPRLLPTSPSANSTPVYNGSAWANQTYYGAECQLATAKPSPLTTKTANVVIDTTGSIDSFWVWNSSKYILFQAGGVTDGNKGVITVSNNGQTWVLNNASVASANIVIGGVTSSNVLDGTIVKADISSNTLDSTLIAKISPNNIAQNGATAGQALVWDNVKGAYAPRTVSGGGSGNGSIQTLTFASDTVRFNLNNGTDAILNLSANSYLKITNATTPSYITLYVTHTTAGTLLTLPGRLPIGFTWATGTNEVTALGGRYDGTTWWWTKDAYAVPFSYQTESTAFFAVNTGLTTGQKTAVDNLVIALKAIGWSKFKVIYPMVGGSASTHKWNLVSPTDADASFRLVFSGTWTHDASGALPNGSNAYANTFFRPLTVNPGVTQSDLGDANINNFHFSFYSGTATAPGSGDQSHFGYAYGGDYINYEYYGTTHRFAQTGSTLNTDATGQSVWTGLNTMSRTSSISAKIYFQGSQIGSTQTGTRSNTQSVGTIYIGAQNSNGTAINFSSYKCQFFSIGYSLTDSEVAALNTAVTNYQTALSR